jgi:hypothetical protein
MEITAEVFENRDITKNLSHFYVRVDTRRAYLYFNVTNEGKIVDVAGLSYTADDPIFIAAKAALQEYVRQYPGVERAF